MTKLQRTVKLLLAALLAVVMLIPFNTAGAGPVDTHGWDVVSGDSPYRIADKLFPACTWPQRQAFAEQMMAQNGKKLNSLIRPGDLLSWRTSIEPVCVVPTTTTTTVPTTTTTTLPPTTTTAPPTTTTTPPSSAGAPPSMAQVGPRGTLTDKPGGTLPCGDYRSVRFTTSVSLQKCAYTFTDVEFFRQLFASYFGGGPGVKMSHVTIRSGTWFENGEHDNWVIEWAFLDGGGGQALRPKGPGDITIRDSILSTHDTDLSNPNIHTESIQTLCNAGCPTVIADRVAFSVMPRWNGGQTPVTGAVNLGDTDPASVITDSWFGYLNPSGQWSGDTGYYTIYPGNVLFVRPVVFKGRANYWYPGPPPSRLISPTYR